MSPEAQRIAIAEACGFINVRMWSESCISSIGINAKGEYWGSLGVPDYLNDLNAMHEAENNIRNSWDTYLSSLIEIRWRDAQTSQHPAYLSPKILWRDAQPNQHPADLSPTRATAAQRSEAYLRTIGKWEGGADE